MKRWKWIGLLTLMALLSSRIASAQVEKVMADAEGIT